MGLIELVAIGAAVGVDTLSVSLGLGALGLSRRRLLQMGSIFTLTTALLFSLGSSAAVGLHHLIRLFSGGRVPGLLGGLPEEAVGERLYELLTLPAAAILLILGMQMLVGGAGGLSGSPVVLRGLPGLVTLAALVSIDAVAAGLSVGILNAAQLLRAILVIGAVNGAMSFLGLGLGNRLRRRVPGRLRPFGGLLLIGISLRLLANLM